MARVHAIRHTISQDFIIRGGLLAVPNGTLHFLSYIELSFLIDLQLIGDALDQIELVPSTTVHTAPSVDVMQQTEQVQKIAVLWAINEHVNSQKTFISTLMSLTKTQPTSRKHRYEYPSIRTPLAMEPITLTPFSKLFAAIQIFHRTYQSLFNSTGLRTVIIPTANFLLASLLSQTVWVQLRETQTLITALVAGDISALWSSPTALYTQVNDLTKGTYITSQANETPVNALYHLARLQMSFSRQLLVRVAIPDLRKTTTVALFQVHSIPQRILNFPITGSLDTPRPLFLVQPTKTPYIALDPRSDTFITPILPKCQFYDQHYWCATEPSGGSRDSSVCVEEVLFANLELREQILLCNPKLITLFETKIIETSAGWIMSAGTEQEATWSCDRKVTSTASQGNLTLTAGVTALLPVTNCRLQIGLQIYQAHGTQRPMKPTARTLFQQYHLRLPADLFTALQDYYHFAGPTRPDRDILAVLAEVERLENQQQLLSSLQTVAYSAVVGVAVLLLVILALWFVAVTHWYCWPICQPCRARAIVRLRDHQRDVNRRWPRTPQKGQAPQAPHEEHQMLPRP